jgi:hypothetical protein
MPWGLALPNSQAPAVPVVLYSCVVALKTPRCTINPANKHFWESPGHYLLFSMDIFFISGYKTKRKMNSY